MPLQFSIGWSGLAPPNAPIPVRNVRSTTLALYRVHPVANKGQRRRALDSPPVSLTQFADHDSDSQYEKMLRGAYTETPTGLPVLSDVRSKDDLTVNVNAGKESSLLA